jgi:hypothetical protein
MLRYIVALDDVNGQLVTALKQYPKVLSKLQTQVEWEMKFKDLTKSQG